ncbi:MAG: thioredoxin family protein [Cyclobacteriaceae bacterium]
MSNVITKEHIEKAMIYEQYLQLTDELLQQNKTTGPNQSPAMVEYTRMNERRMKRLNKIILLDSELKDKLQQVTTRWIWLVITEPWCGDAAQNVPVLAKMAEQNKNINLRLILRDENLDVMDAYLTNGGRSIPKLICLTPELEEIGTWGPRPEPVQQMVLDFKKEENGDYKVFVEKVQLWYARDKTQTMQSEMISLLDKWMAKST